MVHDVEHSLLSRLRLNPHKYLQSSRVHEPTPSPGVGPRRWTPCLPGHLPEVVIGMHKSRCPISSEKRVVSFPNRYQDI